jgi:dihydroorotate dehydrogenase (NAD+) catalytic subunit
MIDWTAVGAIFTKGLSLEPRRGHPPPRIWELPSSMLNAIGLENVGVEKFIAEKMPFLRKLGEERGIKTIANLFATSTDDYSRLTERLSAVEGVHGVEINLSCPNVKEGGIEFGRTPEGCFRVTEAVRNATDLFVSVKLSPASPVAEVGKAAAEAGADALCVGNTMPAMAIDVHTRIPRISAGGGGLSGAALRPIAVKCTYDVARATNIPVIGIGGIATGEDCAEFLLAGASAVQVGTATFANPNAAGKVRDELVSYLGEQQCSLADVVGAVRL